MKIEMGSRRRRTRDGVIVKLIPDQRQRERVCGVHVHKRRLIYEKGKRGDESRDIGKNRQP